MDPIHLIDVLDRGGGTGKLHGPVDHEELGEVRLYEHIQTLDT